MNTIEMDEATGSLGDYVKRAQTEPLVITDHGDPAAIIVSLSNVDLETLSLCTNREFITLIEESRARSRAEGNISSAEMRRRVLDAT